LSGSISNARAKYFFASSYSPKFPKPIPKPFSAMTLVGLISNAL